MLENVFSFVCNVLLGKKEAETNMRMLLVVKSEW